MKLSLLLITAVFSFSSFANTPTEVLIGVSDIYTPAGFDNDDNAEVILTGLLPNSCHSTPKINTIIKDKNVYVRLTALSYEDSNPFCPPATTPFVQKINLGLLTQGEYEVFINPDTEFEMRSDMTIVDVNQSVFDGKTYANVQKVEAVDDEVNTVILKGHNPSYCYKLDRVEFISDNENTYSILPIMEKVASNCPLKRVEFEYEVEVPARIPSEEVLLHVRSMDGSSVNKIVKVQ